MYYVNRSTNSCIEDSHYLKKKNSASYHICKYVFCFDEQQFKMGPSRPDSEWVFSCKTKQEETFGEAQQGPPFIYWGLCPTLLHIGKNPKKIGCVDTNDAIG